MRDIPHTIVDGTLRLRRESLDGNYGDAKNGIALIVVDGKHLHNVIFSSGLGWDHVSVRGFDRVPTWAEMCAVKDLFFEPSDWVVQFHPAESEYVNCHPFVLHLWRPLDVPLPTPPAILVGPITGKGGDRG